MDMSRVSEIKEEQAAWLDGKVEALGLRGIKLNCWEGQAHRAPLMGVGDWVLICRKDRVIHPAAALTFQAISSLYEK